MNGETQKPRRAPGVTCPLWRKDVSKVCHTCDMWEPLLVGVKVEGRLQGETDLWACTIKHQTFLMRDLIKSVDGVQQATESFRNHAWSESQANLRDMVRLAQHWDQRLDRIQPSIEPILIGEN